MLENDISFEWHKTSNKILEKLDKSIKEGNFMKHNDNPFWDPSKSDNRQVAAFYNVIDVITEPVSSVDITIAKDMNIGGATVRVCEGDHVYIIDKNLNEISGKVDKLRTVRASSVNKIVLNIKIQNNPNSAQTNPDNIELFSEDIRFISICNHNDTQTCFDILCDMPTSYILNLCKTHTNRTSISIIGTNIMGARYTFTTELCPHKNGETVFSVPKAIPTGLYKITMLIETELSTRTEYIGEIFVNVAYNIFIPYSVYSTNGDQDSFKITGIDYEGYRSTCKYNYSAALNTNMKGYYSHNMILNFANGLNAEKQVSVSNIKLKNDLIDVTFPLRMPENTCIELFNIPGDVNVYIEDGRGRNLTVNTVSSAFTLQDKKIWGIRYNSMTCKNILVTMPELFKAYCDHPCFKHKHNAMGFSITCIQTKRNDVDIKSKTTDLPGNDLIKIFDHHMSCPDNYHEHPFFKIPSIIIPNIMEGDQYIIRFNHFENNARNIIDYFEYTLDVSFDGYDYNPSNNYICNIKLEDAKRYFVYYFKYNPFNINSYYNLDNEVIDIFDLMKADNTLMKDIGNLATLSIDLDNITINSDRDPVTNETTNKAVRFDLKAGSYDFIINNIKDADTNELQPYIYKYTFNIDENGKNDIVAGRKWTKVNFFNDDNVSDAFDILEYKDTILRLIVSPDSSIEKEIAKYPNFSSTIVVKVIFGDQHIMADGKFRNTNDKISMTFNNEIDIPITDILSKIDDNDKQKFKELSINITGYIFLPDSDFHFYKYLNINIDNEALNQHIINPSDIGIDQISIGKDYKRIIVKNVELPLIKR